MGQIAAQFFFLTNYFLIHVSVQRLETASRGNRKRPCPTFSCKQIGLLLPSRKTKPESCPACMGLERKIVKYMR